VSLSTRGGALRALIRAHFLQAFGLLCVYLLFYAGSFEVNPRYSIQILAPMTVLAPLS